MTKAFEVVVEDGLPVGLPSGATFYVLTKDEVDYIKDRVKRYLSDNHFVNVADLQDVDRMVIMECLVHRWSLWVSREKDYFGDAVDARALRSTINDYSSELRQLKKSLGIDKVARDKQKGDDSVTEYLAQLRVRATEFGVMRESQLSKALELFQQLKMLVTLHDNCFAGDTEILTIDGIRRLRDCVGPVTVLDGNGAWVDGEVKSFGTAPLMKVTLRRWHATKVVYATANHRWFARKRVSGAKVELTTAELEVDHLLPCVRAHFPGNVRMSSVGVAAGVVFGDGCAPADQPGSGAHVTLCGEKDAQLLKYFGDAPTREVVGVGLKVCDLPRSWKGMPNLRDGLPFLYGWLAGYFAADGTISDSGSPSITSHDLANLVAARDVAYRLGLPTLGVTAWTGPSAFGGTKTAYRLNFPVGGLPEEFFLIDGHRRRAAGTQRSGRSILPHWRVESVETTDRVEEVFCAVVPTTRSFVLGDNLLTGNCDEIERREMRCSPDDIFEWMRTVAFVEFDAIDEHFRENQQRAWIRRQ